MSIIIDDWHTTTVYYINIFTLQNIKCQIVNPINSEYFSFCSDLWQTLSQLLCESRGENKALKKDLADLRQLYNDAQEDIQILRETLAKQKNCSNKLKDGTDGMDPRQDLISQLEKSQEKVRWEYTVQLFCTCYYLLTSQTCNVCKGLYSYIFPFTHVSCLWCNIMECCSSSSKLNSTGPLV